MGDIRRTRNRKSFEDHWRDGLDSVHPREDWIHAGKCSPYPETESILRDMRLTCSGLPTYRYQDIHSSELAIIKNGKPLDHLRYRIVFFKYFKMFLKTKNTCWNISPGTFDKYIRHSCVLFIDYRVSSSCIIALCQYQLRIFSSVECFLSQSCFEEICNKRIFSRDWSRYMIQLFNWCLCQNSFIILSNNSDIWK